MISNKYIILIFIFLLAIAYSVGVYRGSRSKALEYENNIKAAQIKSLNNILQAERLSIQQTQAQSIKLESMLLVEKKQNENDRKKIQIDKANINRLNTINYEFVRYIQATTNDNNSMPATTRFTSESSNANSNIPADRILHYTIDLKSHDNQCVIKYNTLLEIYNQQKEITNNFSNNN